MGKITLPSHNFIDHVDPNALIVDFVTNFTATRHPDSIKNIIYYTKCISAFLKYLPSTIALNQRSTITVEGADFLAVHASLLKVPGFPYKPYPFRLPKLILDKFTSTNSSFEENDRFIKIYLLKYDTKDLVCDIEMSVLNVISKNLTVSIALCGDVYSPEFMVLKTVSLGGGVPVFALNMLKNFQDILDFIRLYDASIEAKSFYKNMKELFGECDFVTITGDYRNFEIIAYTEYRIVGKIVDKSFRSSIFIGDKMICIQKGLFDIFTELVNEHIHQVLAKKLSQIMQSHKYSQELFINEIKFRIPEGIMINNNKVTNIDDVVQYYHEKIVDMEFYDNLCNISGLQIHKNFNHIEFGSKNILFKKENDFFCVKLELIKGNQIYARIFCGIFLEKTHIVYEELSIKNDPISIRGWVTKFYDKKPMNLIDFTNFIIKNSVHIVRLYRLKKFDVLVSNHIFIKARLGKFLCLVKIMNNTFFVKYGELNYPFSVKTMRFKEHVFDNEHLMKNISVSLKKIFSFIILINTLDSFLQYRESTPNSVIYEYLGSNITLSINKTLDVGSNNKIFQTQFQQIINSTYERADPNTPKFSYAPNIILFPDLEMFLSLTLNLLNLFIYPSFITPSILLLPTFLILKKDLTFQFMKKALYLRNTKKITRKNNKVFLTAIKNIYQKNKYFVIKSYCSRLYLINESIDSENSEKSQVFYELPSKEWKLIYASDIFTFQITFKEEITFKFIKQDLYNIEIENSIENMINDVIKFRDDYLDVFSFLDSVGCKELVMRCKEYD